MASFDLEGFLANIQNHRCTYAFIAPPVAVALTKHPLVERYDLSRLRNIRLDPGQTLHFHGGHVIGPDALIINWDV